jgi:hypothetical protein
MNRAELKDMFIQEVVPALPMPLEQQVIEDAFQDFITENFINDVIGLRQMYRWSGTYSCLTPEYLEKRMREPDMHRKNRESHRNIYRERHCYKIAGKFSRVGE